MEKRRERTAVCRMNTNALSGVPREECVQQDNESADSHSGESTVRKHTLLTPLPRHPQLFFPSLTACIYSRTPIHMHTPTFKNTVLE